MPAISLTSSVGGGTALLWRVEEGACASSVHHALSQSAVRVGMRRAWEAGEGRAGESVGVQAGPILVCELVHLPADVARQRLGRQLMQRLDAHVCPGGGVWVAKSARGQSRL